VLLSIQTNPAGGAKPSVAARFPGAIKYLHATSTPAVKHSQSKTETERTNTVASKSLTPHSSSVGKIVNTKQEQNSGKVKQRSTRKYATACRRLRSEPGEATTKESDTKESATQTEAAAPIVPRTGTHGLTHGLVLHNPQRPLVSKQSLPTGIAAGRTASVSPNSAQVRSHHAVQPTVQIPPPSFYPPHTPAFPQPHPYPYDMYSAPIPYTLYHPTVAGQYGPAVCNLQPFSTSTSSMHTERGNTQLHSLQSSSHTHLPQHVTEVQQTLGNLASKSHLHFRFGGKKSTEKGGSPQAGLGDTKTASTTEANQQTSNDAIIPTSKQSQPVQHSVDAAATDLKSSTVPPSVTSTIASSSQEIQLLMQEMFTTFQHTVGKIRGSVGTGTDYDGYLLRYAAFRCN